MIFKQLLVPIICLFFISQTHAQKQNLPILKANSPTLSIKIDKHLYRNEWIVDPSIEIDEFVPNRYKEKMTILFISDIDTLAIDTRPNKIYDFFVQLSDGKKALNRVNTDSKKAPTLDWKLEYRNTEAKNTVTDSIPFTLGSDNRIYLKGKINDSENLDILFDTGASAVVITSEAAQSKVSLKLDGQQENEGGDGTHIVKTSSNNEITIGNLAWDGVRLLAIEYGKSPFEVVLGWVAFESKTVEINYDLMQLIIHESMEEIPEGYTPVETTIFRSVPYVKGAFVVGDHESSGWLLYDTGYDGAIFLSQKMATENDLNNKMDIKGSSYSSGSAGVQWKRNDYIIPEFILGELSMERIPMAIAEKDPNDVSHNDILGNDLLKNFNAIIDLANFKIYLKPNRFTR